jgi:hypothetical protein
MKYITSLLIIIATFFLTACPKTRTTMPSVIKDKLIKNRTDKLESLANDYDASITARDFTKAKLDRNEIIFESLQLIDSNYNDFENDLFVRRATTNTLADITELGLAAVTGITNGERVKSILAISLTAFKGSRKSIDVNFFRERTTELIALKMRASRARVLQTIHQGVALPIEDYTLGAALDDLINYLYAGSLNSALLELSQDTGADAKQARARAAELKISPFLAKAEADEFRQIREAAENLRVKLISPNGDTKKQGRKEIETALGQLYDAPTLAGLKDKSDEDLFNMLQDKIEESRDKNDEALRQKILKALNPTP